MASRKNTDLLSSCRGMLLGWGIPAAAMLAAIGIAHPVKTWVWTGALVWMGAACLWNARRCRRRHCFLTGPFFLLMTIPVLLLGYGLIGLGPNGWRWLGLGVALGAFGLTALSERNGKYS